MIPIGVVSPFAARISIWRGPGVVVVGIRDPDLPVATRAEVRARGERRAVEGDLAGPARRAEAGAVDRECRAGRPYPGADVRVRADPPELRELVTPELAWGGIGHGTEVAAERRDRVDRRVGVRRLAGPDVEGERGGQVVGVEGRVCRVVDPQHVHTGAHAGRSRAVVGLGRRQHDVVEAVLCPYGAS